MYVDLNCSWLKHPFAGKTFKITSKNELAIIRSLGLNSILVDPALSDEDAPEQTTEEEAVGSRDMAPGQTHEPIQAKPASDNYTGKPTITRYQESLQQAHAVFKQSLTRSSQDLDDMSGLHAMNVAVLSMLVGRQFDLNHEQTKMLGIAGLLHDIGEQLLPPHLHHGGDDMSSRDRQAFQEHVDFGISMLGQFPEVPHTVTETIRQHHERVDGSGYPAQLKGAQLSLSSRIIMAVDEYERLVNASDIRKNLSPTEALSKLYLTGKTAFSEEVVVALIQTLSVYPPGTIVELTDKSIGLVISINLHTRMRPLLILYDPAVDQGNPLVANLSHDTNRSIARSITRSELPQEVSSYLNLSRWTGYFINPSMETLKDSHSS